MSRPAFEDWFSLTIRRNRKSFIAATASLVCILIVFSLIVRWFKPPQNAATLIALIFGVPALICYYLLTAQRLRDFGLTGWLALLWLPINLADHYFSGAASLAAWIVLCVVPGQEGANRYGPDPVSSTGEVSASENA